MIINLIFKKFIIYFFNISLIYFSVQKKDKHLLVFVMGGEGFEPSKLSQQIYSLPPLATRESTQNQCLFFYKNKHCKRSK